MKELIPQKIKNIYHLGQAVSANFWYGFPSRKMKVIGITGTNGKTTTCQMVTKILEEAGFMVAMASTINFKIGKKTWVNKSKFTTLSSFAVQKFIGRAAKAKCDYLVLETSSHSLDQHRVWGINFDIAVITNVTREHLDYHKTMDDYRIAKYLMFKDAGAAVVNLDMEAPCDYIVEHAKKKIGYTHNPELDTERYLCEGVKIVRAKNIKLEINRSEFEVKGKKLVLKMPGEFNIENALASISVAILEDIKLETASRALEKITGVPGRMDHVQNDRGLDIIIDYAVTPDSLKKLYALVKKIQAVHGNSRIISVFGSCGERDRGKRPMMGKIVGENADYIIVTNEDPYGEDPARIINEVFGGVIKNPEMVEEKNCWKVSDRREAIKKALSLAKSGDIVVVTGKGAEETMMIGDKMIPWNDKKVVAEELAKI